MCATWKFSVPGLSLFVTKITQGLWLFHLKRLVSLLCPEPYRKPRDTYSFFSFVGRHAFFKLACGGATALFRSICSCSCSSR